MRFRSLLALPLAIASVLPLSGCTNEAHTEPGDAPADAGVPSALGNGLRIAEMNTPDSALAPANNQMNVAVTGATFLARDSYAETGTAESVGDVYVQDFHAPDAAAAPYSGILLDKTTFEPASLVLAPGDVVDFTGQYQQYTGPSSAKFYAGQYQPEMYEPIVTFRFDYNPPTPTVIPITDLETYSLGLKWMSMLVTIQDAYGGTYTSDDGRCGVYLTSNTGEDGLTLDNELFDLPCSAPQFGPDAGPGTIHFKSVTGIVTFFINFTLSPRSLDDIVVGD